MDFFHSFAGRHPHSAASCSRASPPPDVKSPPSCLCCAPRFAVVLLAVALLRILQPPPAPAAPGPEWVAKEGHRRAILALPAGPTVQAGFTTLGPELTGILFTNRLDEERSLTNQIFLNGSGVTLGDIDGDGLSDIYLCGLDSPNALYRNLGNWRFADITASAGVGCADQASTGAALVDIDGDGDLDLLVNGIARGTRAFLNEGNARFREITGTSGLGNTSGSTSFAIGDIDGDGLPDVYVVNYRNETMRDQPGLAFTVGVTNGLRQLLTVDGRPADSPELRGRFTLEPGGGVLENGEADALFRNLGSGRFERVDWTSGAFLDERGTKISPPYDWGLSAMFRDIDGDGDPDLYVCNDFQSPDRFWRNEGQGRFRAMPRPALRQTSLFSMGVDFADLDRDGHDDFFVADMLSREHVRRQVQVMNATALLQSRNALDDRPQFSRNTLFRNRGDGTFAEVAQGAGLDASDWTWCPAFLDVDLDGYEDLLVTTGHGRDAQDADAAREIDQLLERTRLSPRDQLRARKRFPRLETPNFAFRNRGDFTFQETGEAWGFHSRRISQSLALGDLDNDGDLDVVVTCLNDGPLICRNESTRPRIAIRLRGQAPNTRGLGARIRVEFPGLPRQSQEMIAGGRYLGSDDPIRSFAAGLGTNRGVVEVVWRSGRTSRIPDVEANRLLEIEEPAADGAPVPKPPAAPSANPFFEDRSRILGQQHVDLPYDDFARQPLLPHSLAQPGPAIAWHDFNNDGWEDLLIGAGRGGRIAAFRNDGQGGFIPQRAQILQTPADRDLTGLLCWRPDPNDLRLLIGLDRYETSSPGNGYTNPPPGLRQISLVTGRIEELPVAASAAPGPLALGDVDGDGDLDLFVGGRVVPGRYPEAASSALLRNDAGRLVADPRADEVLQGVGLVNSALFTALENDARPDLVVACEWGPIRIFRARAGLLAPWDPPLLPSTSGPSPVPATLSSLTGWWNSIATGDFDGDGRLDLVAGNWGRNNARAGFLHHPIRIHYGEIEGSGTLGLIESVFDTVSGRYVPFRDRNALGQVFPSLPARFPTFGAFARASLEDLLADGLPPMRELSTSTFDSVVLLNRPEGFEVRPLPTEAQLAPVYGIAVADFDGDGSMDLFLAQNNFGTSPAESRQDAGWGAWLRGDGRGGFAAVPTSDSGLAIPGEGRGAAVCDFDHDGRPDLAVGQNRGITQLYRNARGEPGLRATLRGPSRNPQAIGALAWLEYTGNRKSPAQEIQLGSGYWSQNAATLLFALPAEPVALHVRSPNGSWSRHAIPEGEREVEFTLPSPTP